MIAFEMWSTHLGFESKITPRTLIVGVELTFVLVTLIEMGVMSFLWKILYLSIWVDSKLVCMDSL